MGSESLLDGLMRCESLCDAYDVLGLGCAWFQDATEVEIEGGREKVRRSEPSRVCGVSVGIKLLVEELLGMKCEDAGESCASFSFTRRGTTTEALTGALLDIE